jgi:hypothetical protein
MYWKIVDFKVNNFQPQGFYSCLSGGTYQPQNQELEAEITIRFRDLNVSSVEDIETEMKNSGMIFEGENFSKEEIENALKEIYPERFI